MSIKVHLIISYDLYEALKPTLEVSVDSLVSEECPSDGLNLKSTTFFYMYNLFFSLNVFVNYLGMQFSSGSENVYCLSMRCCTTFSYYIAVKLLTKKRMLDTI